MNMSVRGGLSLIAVGLALVSCSSTTVDGNTEARVVALTQIPDGMKPIVVSGEGGVYVGLADPRTFSQREYVSMVFAECPDEPIADSDLPGFEGYILAKSGCGFSNELDDSEINFSLPVNSVRRITGSVRGVDGRASCSAEIRNSSWDESEVHIPLFTTVATSCLGLEEWMIEQFDWKLNNVGRR